MERKNSAIDVNKGFIGTIITFIRTIGMNDDVLEINSDDVADIVDFDKYIDDENEDAKKIISCEQKLDLTFKDKLQRKLSESKNIVETKKVEEIKLKNRERTN